MNKKNNFLKSNFFKGFGSCLSLFPSKPYYRDPFIKVKPFSLKSDFHNLKSDYDSLSQDYHNLF